MNMKRIIKPIASILTLFLINSCNLENLDFKNLSDEMNLNPTLALPIATADITGWDLFQSPNKEKGENGLVNLVYYEKDIIRYNVKDLLNFPSQQTFPAVVRTVGEISPGDLFKIRDIKLTELSEKLEGLKGLEMLNGKMSPFPPLQYFGPEVPFDLGEINDFTSITLKDGIMDLGLENKLKVPVTVKGSIYDIGNSVKIYEFTFSDIAPNTTSKTSVSLAGRQVSNEVVILIESFQTPGSILPVLINMDDYLRMTFDLKDMKVISGNVMINSQMVEGGRGFINCDFPELNMKVFSGSLKKGTLKIRAVNPSKLTGNINLSLDEMRKAGSVVQASIPLNGNYTFIDLSATEINFASDLSNPFNRLRYSYNVMLDNSTDYINFNSNSSLKIEISLNDFEFQTLFGDFGNQKLQIDPGHIKMDVFNRLGGEFKIANPKLSLMLHNSFGMTAGVNLKMNAISKTGATLELVSNPPTFNVPCPADIYSSVISDSVVYTRQNSNISEFISLPPNNRVEYQGEITFNEGKVITASNPNFISLESSFWADMKLVLPMELQINNLSFSDTTAISGKNFDKVESAELLINVTNEIPLDMDMQLFFVDTIANIQLGSSKRTQILTAGKIDASGNYLPVETTNTFTLDPNEIISLRKANAIVFSGRIISPLGKDKVISILSTSRMQVKSVIKPKLNL